LHGLVLETSIYHWQDQPGMNHRASHTSKNTPTQHPTHPALPKKRHRPARARVSSSSHVEQDFPLIKILQKKQHFLTPRTLTHRETDFKGVIHSSPTAPSRHRLDQAHAAVCVCKNNTHPLAPPGFTEARQGGTAERAWGPPKPHHRFWLVKVSFSR